MSIFKACDIRGVYGEELTVETALRIGRAVATIGGGGEVVVGGDGRRSTPALKEALIEGLRMSGANVVDLGTVPTPAFYHAVRRSGVRGAVMVTASHNPAAYNGFKLVLGEMPVEPSDIQRVAAMVQSGDFAAGSGGLRTEEGVGPYVDWLQREGPPVPGMEIVVDAGGGCMSEVAPDVLEYLGARVHRLHCGLDPDLQVRNPNPAVEGALAELEAEVQERAADIGLGFDGDGDRVVFVDDRGRTVAAEHAATLLGREVLRAAGGGTVVRDIKMATLVDAEVRRVGGVPVMERSGHAFIRRRMVTEGAVFGCEISGHYFYRRLGGDDDGLLSALLMGDLLVRSRPARLHELSDLLPAPRVTPDIRLAIRPQEVPELLARVEAGLADAELSHRDGVRAGWRDGWGLIRASVTEPVVTLRFEATGATGLRDIARRFLQGAPGLLDRALAAIDSKAAQSWPQEN